MLTGDAGVLVVGAPGGLELALHGRGAPAEADDDESHDRGEEQRRAARESDEEVSPPVGVARVLPALARGLHLAGSLDAGLVGHAAARVAAPPVASGLRKRRRPQARLPFVDPMVILALLIGLAAGALGVFAVVARPALLERRRRTDEVIALERRLAETSARLEAAETGADERMVNAFKDMSAQALRETRRRSPSRRWDVSTST